MQKQVRENPYNRLKRICSSWADKVQYPHTVFMWRYPKNKLSSTWSLTDLYERTQAAQDLGYQVIITADKSDGLNISYQKKAPERPWELRY